MTRPTRLELTRIGKDHRPKLEPRVLVEDPTKSYRNKTGISGGLIENRLVFGDNLLALKALEQEYSGQVKCA